MAIVRIGSFTSTGAATTLNLGFIPSYICLEDADAIGSGSGVAVAEGYPGIAPNGAALIQTLTAGVPTYSAINTNGFTPFSTVPGQEYVETNKAITAITNAANAQVTSTAHGFTAADVGVTTVTFSGVVGMTQINTLRGVIQAIVDANNFTVNINTTSFSTFTLSGHPIINVITGIPPVTQTGFQVYNTPLLNTGYEGVIIGSAICGTSGDEMLYRAYLDASFTSD